VVPSTSYATFTSPVAALIAPIRVLADMLGRCPLYLSHGPAAEIVLKNSLVLANPRKRSEG